MKSSTARLVVRMLAILLSATAIWITYHLSLKHVELARQQELTKTTGVVASQPAPSDSLLDRVCTAAFANANCEEVLKSESAYFRLGHAADGSEIKIPAAWLGMVYFTAIFWWLMLIGPVSRSRSWMHLLFACVAALSLGMSVWFVIQMIRLDKYCTLCLASHAINLLLFICVLLLWPRASRSSAAPPTGEGPFVPALAEPAPPEPVWPHNWMLSAGLVIVILSIMVEQQALRAYGQSLRSGPSAIKTELEQTKKARDWYQKAYSRYESKWQHTYTDWVIAPVLPIQTNDRPARTFTRHDGRDSFSYEPEPARHTLVIFSDFQCPGCRRFEELLRRSLLPIAARNGGVRIVFKQWPICRDCNPDAERSIHPLACKAAAASEAAYLIGGNEAFWQMHDMLFAKQDEWSRGSLAKAESLFKQYAADMGLNADRFAQTMNGEEALRRIQADLAEAAQFGSDLFNAKKISKEDYEFMKVSSTPSMFIDGKKLSSPGHYKAWEQILAQPTQTAPASAPASQPAASGGAAPR